MVAVNSVPTPKAGMASGATSMLRDFGLTLGPAIVGAIALTSAANAISAKMAATPSLQKAARCVLRRSRARAGRQVGRPSRRPSEPSSPGPLGANAVPSQVPGPDGKLQPFNPIKDIAFHALSHGYAIGYLVCGIAALLAALVAGGDARRAGAQRRLRRAGRGRRAALRGRRTLAP